MKLTNKAPVYDLKTFRQNETYIFSFPSSYFFLASSLLHY